jgi:glycosyltransferase involved in cell wall biosynthesis
MENSVSSGASLQGSVLSVPKTHAPGIVVFSHLRWKFVWQRPQQFLSRFAQTHRVLFIEEPIYDLPDGEAGSLELEAVAPNIMVSTVHLAQSIRFDPRRDEVLRSFARDAIDTFNMKGEFDSPLLWYYGPMEAAWSLGYFENSGIIYDCMDELSQFRGAPAELVSQEQRLMNRADIVFTGGYQLWLKKSKQHPNVHFFGCGVEVEHFGKARLDATPVPSEIANLSTPVVGWFGVIDERMDYDLVRGMAELRPDWSFVMVGPVVKVDPADLPKASNIHWLGGRDYKDLPSYCKGFDVCVMAFALNEATEYINPTKALEYLATGRPVISTPVADVVRQYSDLVYIEKDAKGFVDRIEQVLADPDVDRIERGIEKAQGSSWDNTVSQMQGLIVEATGGDPAVPPSASTMN